MRYYHRILLGLSIVFFMLWIFHMILRSMDYLAIIQVYLPVSLGILLFGLTGLFSYLFLFFFSMGWMPKALLSIMALMGIFFLGLTSFGSGDFRYDIYENGEYTLIIQENRFLFAGEKTIYQKMNGFVAKKIITCEAGEDFSCHYEIIDNQLKIEVYYNGELYESDLINLYQRD